VPVNPIQNASRTLGVIPARLASTRLHRKVLRQIAGRPMLAWVYDAARACPQLDNLLIATDSDEVAALCHENSWPVVMTSPDLASGSDRVHAVAQSHPADIYVTPQNITNPNAVKVVTAIDGRALYFSRSTLPYDRDGIHPPIWKHLGIYAYRAAALARFHALASSPLELTERLEQLRFLENNIPVYVAETTLDTIGVDTEEDLHRVEAILRSQP